ncbi:MAG: hypothetical protein WBA57_26525 [Elainellaceae cyanobacterium]
MENATFRMISIECRLSQLEAIAPSTIASFPDAAVTALQLDQPFSLRVTVEFLSIMAIALLRLAPQIRVDFYAKPIVSGDGYELGTVAIAAQPNQFTYTLTQELDTPHNLGLINPGLYRVGAIFRVGAPDGPAMISGLLESLVLEIYAGEASQPSKRKSKR